MLTQFSKSTKKITSQAPTLYPNLQAVVFDIDGVINDTESLKFAAWQDALEIKGIIFTLKDYLPLVGYDSQYIIDAIMDKNPNVQLDKKQLILDKDNAYHEKQKLGVPLLANAIALFKALIEMKSEHNLKLGVASSAARVEIIENLKQAGIPLASIDALVSGKDDLDHYQDPQGKKNKPRPYIYQEALKLLDIEPRNAIALEDTNAGILAAFSAGMKVIAVPNEYTKGHDFTHAAEAVDFDNVELWQNLQARLQASLMEVDNSNSMMKRLAG